MLLAPGDVVKLVDFGFSAVLPAGGDDGSLKERCGSLGFMAPELLDPISKIRSGRPVDIWATGVLLSQLLCGKYPFRMGGVHEEQLAKRLRKCKPTMPPAASSEACALLVGLLAPEPEKRLVSADALAHPWLQPRHPPAAPLQSTPAPELPSSPKRGPAVSIGGGGGGGGGASPDENTGCNANAGTGLLPDEDEACTAKKEEQLQPPSETAMLARTGATRTPLTPWVAGWLRRSGPSPAPLPLPRAPRTPPGVVAPSYFDESGAPPPRTNREDCRSKDAKGAQAEAEACVLERMGEFGFDAGSVLESVRAGRRNYATAAFRLLLQQQILGQ